MSPTASPHRSWLFALFLVAATFIAYYPAWHGGFLWDDGNFVPQGFSQSRYYSLSGLADIWFHRSFHEPHQYYPLSYTICWVGYRLWGPNTTGFHLMNILLHALNAILLWLVLRRLKVPGAWLAGAVFALHPVNVESAAWIAETKNTLSCFFFLCSILAGMRFWLPELFPKTQVESPSTVAGAAVDRQSTVHSPRSPVHLPSSICHLRFYWLSFAFFVCALLSKTSTLPLPAVLLLLVWWKRGKIARADVYQMVLFFATAFGMGLITHYEEHNLGAHGTDFQISLVDRFLIAGRDFWFYLEKLFWPRPLMTVYPRWKIAPSPPLAWLSLLAFIPVAIILWMARHSWGRPVFVALAYFGGMLFLVLGFFNVYFFIYSFVADHFQYLALMGPLALACAGIGLLFRRLGQAQLIFEPVLAGCLLALLGFMTWGRCRAYADMETLWRVALAQNPDAYMAYANLGDFLLTEGKADAAIEQFQKALALHPDAESYHNLGTACLKDGKTDEAYADFKKSLDVRPDYAVGYGDLGTYFLQKGSPHFAIEYLLKAMKMDTNDPFFPYNLGNAYSQKGQPDVAIRYWENAVAVAPDFAPAHNALGNAFSSKGQAANAIQHWRSALAAQPDLVSAQVNLAWVLATSTEDPLRNGSDAVELAKRANELTGGQDPMILKTLAAAYAENSDFPDAIKTAQQAIQIATRQDDTPSVNALQRQMNLYQNNQPYRETVTAPVYDQ
ncbi:MAG TPA: tetratricopeptide repeat protein [Verrucomicrobiae bacterium]|nr:tetratricopeptide repeat protein [Verrucomicrobiae bacterium]